MRNILVSIFLIVAAGVVTFGQDSALKDVGTARVDIFSPWQLDGGKMRHDPSLYARSCFDLLRLEVRCGGMQSIGYGDRFGDNWDIFNIAGTQDSQTRMIDLGKHDWNEKLEIPWVQPWAKLRPGEQRNVTVNTSGADGADGRPGMNGDGTYSPAPTDRRPRKEGFADKPVSQQVSSAVKTDNGGSRPDNYTPFMQVAVGHMYAIRVVDPTNDFYLVIRVDDLARGTKATISIKKVDGPTKQPVF